MTWSVSFIGKPAKIVEALKERSLKETGQCKIEFDDALPHLIGLVSQNFAEDGLGHLPPVIRLTANGHGYVGASKDGPGLKQYQRSCNVVVETLGSNLLL